jgi:hypothetical protein
MSFHRDDNVVARDEGESRMHVSNRRTRAVNRALKGTGLVAAVAVLAVPVGVANAQDTASATVSGQPLGVNTNSGDRKFSDAVVPGLLHDAGIGIVRYPGGGGADNFNWMTGGPLTWPMFMSTIAAAGAAPYISVNYGGANAGPPLAASWVTNALTYPNYSDAGARWVLSNEVYGQWENDTHPNPHTPASFVQYGAQFADAMHAVDPNVQVGFPYPLPRTVAAGTGTWVADPDTWDKTIVSQDAAQFDFADVHWYPIFGIPHLDNDQLFETVDRIPGAMKSVHDLLNQYDPTEKIIAGEGNISQSEIVNNAWPVSALFAAASSLKFLSRGAETYQWWQVHNSDNLNGDFGFLSDATVTGTSGATALSAPAAAGDVVLNTTNTTNFHTQHSLTIGSGAGAEVRKIVALPGATTLSADAVAGASNVKVAATSKITTNGSTTDYHWLFGPGTPVTIGTGATAETRTVVSTGTPAVNATLAAPSAAGDTNVKIVGVGMGGQNLNVFMPIGFAPGAQVTIGTGDAAETATVKSVLNSSSLGTTTVSPANPGDSTVYVATVTNSGSGVANYAGDEITIDSGANEETGTIKTVGTNAGTATTTVLPAAVGDTTLYVASIAGDTVGHPFTVDTAAGAETGTVASIGTAASTTRTLSAATAVGDTVVKLSSVTGLTVGDKFIVDTGANLESAKIASIGTAGATGTGVTLATPLTLAHASGVTSRDAGTGVTLAAPLTLAHATGVAARDLGLGITLTAPLTKVHASGVATRDAGTGITLTAPLTKAHATGDAANTPGTGLTLSAPLSLAHASGDAAVSTGITITPKLTTSYDTGATVTEPGLNEPPVDTPMPAYWGYKMSSLVARPGAKLTDYGMPANRVRVYGSYLNGIETVMLINTDDAAWKTVSVGTGALPDATVQTTSYSLEHPQITTGSTTGGAASAGLTLEPESITVLTSTAASAPTVALGPSSGVGGTVAATLSLTLGAPASFGAFTPGLTKDYSSAMTANVISTAGDATLSVADPSATATGHLVNGAFSLPSVLQAKAASAAGVGGAFANVGGSAAPTSLLTYAGPTSNDAVTLSFLQHIGSTDALRTGSYSKTLTFTLSTTTP